MNEENKMEIIQQGIDNIHEADALNCCWPPGTMNMQMPEPE